MTSTATSQGTDAAKAVDVSGEEESALIVTEVAFQTIHILRPK
jgi:hypothetical protein